MEQVGDSARLWLSPHQPLASRLPRAGSRYPTPAIWHAPRQRIHTQHRSLPGGDVGRCGHIYSHGVASSSDDSTRRASYSPDGRWPGIERIRDPSICETGRNPALDGLLAGNRPAPSRHSRVEIGGTKRAINHPSAGLRIPDPVLAYRLLDRWAGSARYPSHHHPWYLFPAGHTEG